MGLCAGFAAVLIAASPPLLIQAVAGLALLSSLAAAMGSALADESQRLAAIVTFVTTASGVTIGGIAGASIEIVKTIFFIAVILFLISAVVGLARGRSRV